MWRIEQAVGAWSVEDEVTGGLVPFGTGRDAHLVGVHQRAVWFRTPLGIVGCDMRDGACSRGEMPGLPLAHRGPGAGFRLSLEHGDLALYLPQDADRGIPLASGVARILGAYWVRRGTGEADEALDRIFRGRARLHASPRAIDPDGNLADWSGTEPLLVESPWQLQSGGDGWGGARDASFSVVAAWTVDAVCLGGRLRDDEVTDDDALTVRLAGATRTLALRHPEGGAVVPEWLGASWELCLPTRELAMRAAVPLAVSYADADPGEATTVLTTAPEADGVPLGTLLLETPS